MLEFYGVRIWECNICNKVNYERVKPASLISLSCKCKFAQWTRSYVTFEQIMQLWCPSWFRILRNIPTHSILSRKTKKPWYNGHYWQLQILWRTNTQKNGHGNSIKNPSHWRRVILVQSLRDFFFWFLVWVYMYG